MPNMVHGDSFKQKELPNDVLKKDYKYDYPDDGDGKPLDLKPGSKLHDELVSEVLQRARESSNTMSKRHSSWNDIDRTLTVYAEVDEDEEEVQDVDPRRPVTIVFPYSFIIMETMLSYLVAAFFQDPVFRYIGVSPEDIQGAELLKYVIQQNCERAKVLLNLHTMFRDCVGYGFGVTAPGWRVDEGYRTRATKSIFGAEKYTEEAILYEVNDLTNIEVYKCLPDPNVSIHEVQSGEYFGYVEATNYMDLLTEEKTSEDLFNVKYLKHMKYKRTSIYAEDASDRERKFGRSFRQGSTVTNETDYIRMFIKIIPKDWKLGSSEYPEKWVFRVAADSILIEAKPLGLNHNKFPIAIGAPDFDGYSTTPVSRMETLYGLQHVLDWLFNSHITNVRKAVNDMFVVDPYIVNIEDLKTPAPGKIIRTRRPVWGKGVKDAIQQLQVADITRANIGDATFIMEYMEKIGSTGDAMMGHLRKSGPERLTGAEFEGTRAGAFSRLERMAKVIGVQAMQDIGYFFASHTQQLMSEDTYIKTVGTWPETLRDIYGDTQRIKVRPTDLLIEYDVSVRDGSIPGSNFSRVWIDMFKIISEHPELQKSFDTVRIFKHIARNSGAKDVNSFIRTKAMPDEQIMRQSEAGNIIPFQGGMQ